MTLFSVACFPWSLLFLFLDALLYQKITVRKHTFIWLILLFPIWNFSEENPNLTNQMLIRCRVIKSTGEWYNFQLYWWWKIEYLPALYPHFFFFFRCFTWEIWSWRFLLWLPSSFIAEHVITWQGMSLSPGCVLSQHLAQPQPACSWSERGTEKALTFCKDCSAIAKRLVC